MGTLDFVAPLVIFNKSRLMLARGFSFTHPHLKFIFHTLHYNTSLIQMHSSISSSTYRYKLPCNVSCRIGAKIKWVILSPLSTVKWGSYIKMWNTCNEHFCSVSVKFYGIVWIFRLIWRYVIDILIIIC